MTIRLRFGLSVLFFLTTTLLFVLNAQNFKGVPLQRTNLALSKTIDNWEAYSVDANAIFQHIQENPLAPGIFDLTLGTHNWKLSLYPSGLQAANYRLQVLTPTGLEVSYPKVIKAYRGLELHGNQAACLTVDSDYLSGMIISNGETWFIEPLSFYQADAPENEVIVYRAQDVMPMPEGFCMALETEESMQNFSDKKEGGAESMACYEIEIAIASDRSMFNKYGSVSAVENHNITVLNNVQTNYTGNFNHDIELVIVTQFVVTGSDPWTSSLDAGTLLSSFRTWGNAGNFGVAFDNGELWTNRDFNGGTIGIAYLNGLCNSNRYHCLQDFSSNQQLLRVLTAHEIGHNCSATHDNIGCPGAFIMCPSVNSSNEWSSQSQSQINGYIQNRINSGCLQLCGNSQLLADFEWEPFVGCVGQPVQFTDLSTGNITSRSWTFQNGIPGTSNQTNPTATWNQAGTFNVTLQISNGGNSATVSKQITIEPLPVANFSFTVDQLTATFTNLSTGATAYIWDFGDGNASFEQNPTHTYLDAGTYTVTLTAEGPCGTSVKTLIVNTFPVAQFSADPTEGCAALTVQFTNESSNNATSFVWQFPGGSPVSSSQPNPVVVYSTSGLYTVTLTAYNNAGSSTYVATDYITVNNIPSANFNFTVNGLQVSFDNLSNGATSYNWDFGDGNTSNQAEPVHTYNVGGSYTVVMTAINDCGSTTRTRTVNLVPPPVALFGADVTNGCADLTVTFSNLSSGNPDSLRWFFPGGNPSTSSSNTPVVTYSNPGAYDVTLIAMNVGGPDTLTIADYITVEDVPVAGFTSNTNLLEAVFSNTTQNGNSYFWDFGDGATSTQSDPTHTYPDDGVYNVMLIATNACGPDTILQTVTIVTPPLADFGANPLSGCASLTVQFSNLSSDNTTSLNWIFNGGTPASSTDENPTVTYNQPGTYTVTLIASNSLYSDTLIQTDIIVVTTVPVAGFTVSTNDLEASFNNSSNNATSYFWNFGDGATSTEQNPVHTYDEDGQYEVMLIATNACGPDTIFQTVTISTAPQAGFNAGPVQGCAPLTVQFNNQSSNNATSFFWEFPGGDPSSSTDENPVVVYDTPGSYSVTLVATNSVGSDTITQTNYIQVNTLPAAGFDSAVMGAQVELDNTSSGASSYLWDFGNGDTSSEEDPVYTYDEDGDYTITLIAINACGNDTTTQSVTIVTPPVAGFSADATSGCAPFTVQFNNESSDNAATFEWTFDGGNPASSTDENPVVVYDAPGTYTVVLTVGNPAGTNTVTLTDYITVGAAPTAGFASDINGAVVNFNNNSAGADSYAWDFGDNNTSNDANPTHTYAEDGTYQVTLIATNTCGNDTLVQEVTIITPPVAAFSADLTTGCAPLTVQFNNESSENATDFFWEFEGGTPATSSEENPSATWNQAGTYTVTFTASNSAGSNSATLTIVVDDVPTAAFTSQLAGLAVVLDNQSDNADSYFWEFGDGNTSTDENPTHTYSLPGSYTITLEATNQCGTNKTTMNIEIMGAAPIAGFTAETNEGCAPLEVSFMDQSVGDPTFWEWSFEGATPNTSLEQNPTVNYAAPGVYNVTLIVGNLFGQDTITIPNYVVVNTVPEALFEFQTDMATVTFVNNSQDADLFSWNFGDGNSSTDENPVHTYNASGTYTVELTAINDCGASTLQQIVEIVIVGVTESDWINSLVLYPNPNQGAFNLEMTGAPEREIRFNLFNNLGQLVKTDRAEFHTGVLSKSFQYTDLQAGVYTLSLETANKRHFIKLVVQ